jgi:hypothetical protein
MLAQTVKREQTLAEKIARIDPEVLTPIGKSVLATLVAYGDRYTGRNIWVSLERVVALVGFSHGAVLAAVKHLHAIGALVYDDCDGRPDRVDKRVRGRAIVIAHLAAAPKRSVHQVDSSDPSTRRTKIRPPGGLGSVHQVDATFPPPSSPSETRPDRPENHTPKPPRVGGSASPSEAEPDDDAKLERTLDELGVARGPTATPKWVHMARKNPNIGDSPARMRNAIRWAVAQARAHRGEDAVNFASDARFWLESWRPAAMRTETAR